MIQRIKIISNTLTLCLTVINVRFVKLAIIYCFRMITTATIAKSYLINIAIFLQITMRNIEWGHIFTIITQF